EERAVNQDRRRLERDLAVRRRAAALTRAVGPGDLQPRDIGAVDLGQRGIPRAAGIVAVGGPLIAAGRVPAERSHASDAQEDGHREERGPWPSPSDDAA